MLIDQIRHVKRDLSLHLFHILTTEKPVDLWIALSETCVVEDFCRHNLIQAQQGELHQNEPSPHEQAKRWSLAMIQASNS